MGESPPQRGWILKEATMSDYDEGIVDEMAFPDNNILQNEESRKAILNELNEGYGEVKSSGERQNYLERVDKWRRQREGRPEQEAKDFPWAGASNVMPPIALQTTNGAYANLKGSLAARKPFWVVLTKDESKKDMAEAWQILLDTLAESKYHLNLRPAMRTILYDLASLGTQFVKTPWITNQWNFKRKNASTGAVDTVSKIVQDCPTVIPIRLENFITRSFWTDLQRAPWVQEEVYLMEHELRQAGEMGIYNENLERVLKRSADELDENRVRELERMGISLRDIRADKMYCLVEARTFQDIDGDGVPEDTIIWYDPITGLDLRSEFNDLGVRPYVRVPYLDRPYELYGMGVGWIVESLQEEIEALHNMRIDSTMLSMLQMYVTRRGAMAPNERFRPLKQIVVDDPSKDFLPVKFPDIGMGTLQAELMAKEYGDRATMFSDAAAGYESKTIGSRATASGTMFLAGQNQKGFSGAVLEAVEEAFSDIGQMVTFQLIRNKEGTRKLFQLVPSHYHAALNRMLELNVEDIPSSFTFRVWTTDIEKTEENKQRGMMMMAQMYMQYGQQIFALLPVVFNPQQQVPPEIKETAMKFIIGATKMMEEIFKGLGEQDAQKFLPYLRDLEYFVHLREQAKNALLEEEIRRSNVRANGGGMEAVTSGGGTSSPVGGQS